MPIISPVKGTFKTGRAPLKETDTNAKRNVEAVKRKTVERLEQQQLKRAKTVETGQISRRNIEGAVQTNKQNDFKKAVAEQSKVTPRDLAEWQANWRKILRKDTKIYFDNTEVTEPKHKFERRRDILRQGFSSLGATITSFFDTSVTVVITRRTIKDHESLPDTDVLVRAHRRYMKIWNYDKALRFLKNLDVDLEALETSAQQAHPTLSNLLQNEKLYGPSDRDPRARRDDVHYFKYPHVYLYDLWQVWAPLITAEWRPHELSCSDKLPYPDLKPGTFGRCPFVGDGHCNEASSKRIIKRYRRDKYNEEYALHLRLIYQESAQPRQVSTVKESEILLLPHNHPNSKKCYHHILGQLNLEEGKADESIEPLGQKQEASPSNSFASTSLKPPFKTAWKTPALANINIAPTLMRQETEELADDLCRKKSRIPQEIKASGVTQSNEGSASVGNGLGPTKASVTNKSMKSLNRLVVDKKLQPSKPTATTTRESVPMTVSPAVLNADETNDAPKDEKSKEKKTVVKRQDARMGSGYCENCRVKYESLSQHVKSEKHLHFAQDDVNFEAIDSLIEKLAAARAFTGVF
ncbi:LAMI_0G00672g1_1 [Lachancea mirantina]|uniref:LAMI_0G00672g1_1 n=1 Tax=Lachancea mirantina TaxID=1230905 RepID=A0A1G4K770_9SACH|nr:LAMI_0G00672g1_1 [Lachancea mirantina]